MRRDNKGISKIVEFVIMFTIFLVIVTSFYSLVNIWTRPPIVNYNQEEAMRISEILIGNPGCMDNNNSKINWEEYPAYYKDAPNIDTNMTSLGFTKDKQSYGVLSMSKILGMGKITYSNAREMLVLSPGQNFNISFQIIGNETKTCWGADYTSAKNVGMYKRIVSVYNPINNSYTGAKITICLFDGRFYDESIKINEIMYAPPLSSNNKWIELYNPTSMAVNVTGWIIGEETSSAKIKGVEGGEYLEEIGPRGCIIQSNSFAILPWHSRKGVYENFTFGPDAIWLQLDGTLSTLNPDDTITLKNKYYDIVDSVSYSSSWGGADANGNNESLEKINPFGENVDGNWDSSTTGLKGGTLGRRNSISDFSNPNFGNLISVGPDRCNISCSPGDTVSFNITVMNNGNINDTIIISNISGWNVNITYLSGGNATPVYLDGAVAVNLSAINLTDTDNISHIYVKLRVNVTIPAGTPSGTQNTAIVIAKSSEYSMVFDTTILLTKIL